MKSKEIKVLSLIIIICLCLSVTAYADFSYENYLLDPEELDAYGDVNGLNAKAEELSNAYGIVISVAVIDDKGQAEPDALADELYMEAFGGYDGILLLYFDNQLEGYVATYGKASKLFGDTESKQLIDAFDSRQYYGECVFAYLSAAERILGEKVDSGELIVAGKNGIDAEQAAAENPDAVVTDTAIGADAIPEQRQQPRLVDNANLLNSDEKSELTAKLDEISERQMLDVALVTMPNFSGKEPQAFADDFFDYEGYGFGEDDDGILFAIDMENRKWAISTYGYAITAFTDNGLIYLTDEFLPYLSSGEYYTAFSKYAELCDELITMARSGEPYDKAENGTDASFWINLIPFSLIIGFIVSLFSAKRHKAKLLNVQNQIAAEDYTRSGSRQLYCSEDTYLNTNVTRRKLEKERNGNSSSSGGSSVHTSSSGRSHGGSSGSF